eukprot:4991437-Pleurochrysis_carterae.AAC.1
MLTPRPLPISYPCDRACARFAAYCARARCIDERQRASQLLHLRQHDGPLPRRHARVHSICPPVAGVRCHPRLGVVLKPPGAPRAVVDEPLSRLQNDVAWLEPAGDEREVPSGWRHPLLPQIGFDGRRRRRRLRHQAWMVEGEYGHEFAL